MYHAKIVRQSVIHKKKSELLEEIIKYVYFIINYKFLSNN